MDCDTQPYRILCVVGQIRAGTDRIYQPSLSCTCTYRHTFRLYRFNALILIYEQQEISCTLTIILHTL